MEHLEISLAMNDHMPCPFQAGRVVAVTGANRGIGRYTALALARQVDQLERISGRYFRDYELAAANPLAADPVLATQLWGYAITTLHLQTCQPALQFGKEVRC